PIARSSCREISPATFPAIAGASTSRPSPPAPSILVCRALGFRRRSSSASLLLRARRPKSTPCGCAGGMPGELSTSAIPDIRFHARGGARRHRADGAGGGGPCDHHLPVVAQLE